MSREYNIGYLDSDSDTEIDINKNNDNKEIVNNKIEDNSNIVDIREKLEFIFKIKNNICITFIDSLSIELSHNIKHKNSNNIINSLNNLKDNIKFKNIKDILLYAHDLYSSILVSDVLISNNNLYKSMIKELNMNNNYIHKEDLHISNNLENSWTLLLKGKNILIISDYCDKLKNVMNNKEKIYNIDLFPECNILIMDSPIIYNNTKTIQDIKEIFMKKINELQREIDVILIDMKYYSYLFIHEFYKLNKSCIQLDEDLKYYFGIYDNDFINNHKDILTI
jgi:hypothetical protein